MRETKYCCFRFDVDTHACVTRGMPPLLEVAETLGVKFTFFLNMGRAFDRRISLGKLRRRLLRKTPVRHITAAAKLGLYDSALAALFNPKVGSIAPGILRAAQQAGHELGLHGGRNHMQWEHFAGEWTREQLADEIQWGLNAMDRHGIAEPVSFASPAWNSPEMLKEILPPLGFNILADTYDSGAEDVTLSGPMHSVPTNITPGDGRAGYLETLQMQGMQSGAMSAHFKARLAGKSRLAIVYDHPFFAGIHALPALRQMVETAVANGFNVCAIREAVKGFEASAPRMEALRS